MAMNADVPAAAKRANKITGPVTILQRKVNDVRPETAAREASSQSLEKEKASAAKPLCSSIAASEAVSSRRRRSLKAGRPEYPRSVSALEMLEDADTDDASDEEALPCCKRCTWPSERRLLRAFATVFVEVDEPLDKQTSSTRSSSAGTAEFAAASSSSSSASLVSRPPGLPAPSSGCSVKGRRRGAAAKSSQRQRERELEVPRPPGLCAGEVEDVAKDIPAQNVDAAPKQKKVLRGCGKERSSAAATLSGKKSSEADRKLSKSLPEPVESLIKPLATSGSGEEAKRFVGFFRVGIEDDEEFAVVRRIFGKGGCNMKSIAEAYDAKLRLRGRGSGFLEGSGGQEASIPLQLFVSCKSYASYKGSVEKAATLLTGLYTHYDRYLLSKKSPAAKLNLSFEETVRDDLKLDEHSNKSQAKKRRHARAPRESRQQAAAGEAAAAEEVGTTQPEEVWLL
eukprot:TRINITY_DN20603_c0_g2_i1.p1 TRINITY_DN20603_c0_g2~~TRINITY_DN20603_c0_g2_i1.p1  ORF type:complete len:454 (+),score=139.18 TRINITY_DN20603_c0_g2_i1:57-1418(+)